jgi:hypothetical protein
MLTTKTLFTTLSLGALVLAASGFALQTLALVQDNQNILRNRIDGKWTLNASMTRQLQPEPGTALPSSLAFTTDPTVAERLASQKDRLNGLHIFQAGMLTMDGKTCPYVVTNEHGNATLLYFPSRGNEVGAATAVALSIGVGRPKTQDILFFGGTADGTSGSGAYQRAEAVATPASAPK